MAACIWTNYGQDAPHEQETIVSDIRYYSIVIFSKHLKYLCSLSFPSITNVVFICLEGLVIYFVFLFLLAFAYSMLLLFLLLLTTDISVVCHQSLDHLLLLIVILSISLPAVVYSSYSLFTQIFKHLHNHYFVIRKALYVFVFYNSFTFFHPCV